MLLGASSPAMRTLGLVLESIAAMVAGSLEHDERIKGGPQWASPRSYNKWVGKRCMNSTDLAAVLCHSVQRAIRSAIPDGYLIASALLL